MEFIENRDGDRHGLYNVGDGGALSPIAASFGHTALASPSSLIRGDRSGLGGIRLKDLWSPANSSCDILIKMLMIARKHARKARRKEEINKRTEVKAAANAATATEAARKGSEKQV